MFNCLGKSRKKVFDELIFGSELFKLITNGNQLLLISLLIWKKRGKVVQTAASTHECRRTTRILD